MKKNVVKTDTILKNFWRDNKRFADLFNAVLFEGREVLDAGALVEVDTDVSSILKFNGHAETLQRIFDVVKKSGYGAEFAILGLENQQKVNFAMPLRHMVGDALGYLKEYTEIAKKNKEAGSWKDGDEFLSGLKKEDRLHPMVTICVYYGEESWDGPCSLTDMLEIPQWLKPVVSDYRMYLIQVRESEKYKFRSRDVNTVFEVSRNIYKRDYVQLEDTYRSQEIDAELGLVIGAITGTKEIIRQALKSEGGKMNMCSALEELKREGIEEGIQRGIQKGILQGKMEGIIKTYKEFGASREAAVEKLRQECDLTTEQAWNGVRRYW